MVFVKRIRLSWIGFKIRKSVSIRNRICSSEKNYLSSKGFGPGFFQNTKKCFYQKQNLLFRKKLPLLQGLRAWFFRNTKKVFLSETESVLQKKITSPPRGFGPGFFEIRKKCFYQKQNPLFRKNSSLRRVLKLDLFQKNKRDGLVCTDRPRSRSF